jgi:hypothetical protein
MTDRIVRAASAVRWVAAWAALGFILFTAVAR